MNAERLRGFVQYLVDEDKRLKLQQLLTELRDALANLAGNPGDTNHQNTVSNNLGRLLKALVGSFYDTLDPPDKVFLREIDAERFFSPELVEKIQASIAANAMTPSVVRDEVSELASEREQFLEGLRKVLSGFDALGIEENELVYGEAEIGILLPRDIFKNDLDRLSKELHTISKIIDVFSEIATGKTELISVKQISTSDPLFSLSLDPNTIVLIGSAITWLLNTWQSALTIKELRNNTKKSGHFTDEELSIYDNKVKQIVDESIEEHVAQLMSQQPKGAGRPRELENASGWAMRELLARIERGMTVEIRYLPPEENASAGEGENKTSSAEQATFARLEDVVPKLVFPEPSGQPLLRISTSEPPTKAPRAKKSRPPSGEEK